MSVLDPLARPRIALAVTAADPLTAAATGRGLTHGLRARLPLACVVATMGGHAGGPMEVTVVAGGLAQEPQRDGDGEGGEGATPKAVITLPRQAGREALELCTAALPDDLGRRRLSLLRRLGWLPADGPWVVTDGSAAAASAVEQARSQIPELGLVALAALAGPGDPSHAHSTACDCGASPGVPPPELSIDDMAAIVLAAAACAGSHALLVALAAGAGLGVLTTGDALVEVLRGTDAGARSRPLEAGSRASVNSALDGAAARALERWRAAGSPGSADPRLASARAGAVRCAMQVEGARRSAELATAAARLTAAEDELAAIHHSRTWRYSRTALARLRTVRLRPPGGR